MEIIWLIIGYSAGVLTGVYLGYKIAKEIGEREKHPAPSAQNEAKVLKFVKTNGKITNNDVEELLGVSDSTAQRYLQKMVDENLLKQNGKTGRNVYYSLP